MKINSTFYQEHRGMKRNLIPLIILKFKCKPQALHAVCMIILIMSHILLYCLENNTIM